MKQKNARGGYLSVLICLLSGLILFGCSDQGPLTDEHPVNYNVMKDHMQTIEIEGCEYWVYSCRRAYSGFGFMAHKGNCKNPIHR